MARALLRTWMWAASVGVLLAPAAQARYSVHDERTDLRRRIAELARQLRDSKRGVSNVDDSRYLLRDRSGRSRNSRRNDRRPNPLGIDVVNPFGPALDFGSLAWDSSGRGNHGLFPPVRRGTRDLRPRDLSGRPLAPIRRSRLQRPPSRELVRKRGDDGKAAEEDGESSEEATNRALAAAQTLFDNGEFGAARRMLVPIAASRRRSQEEVDAAKKFIERIDREGMKRVLEADEAAANGNVDQAAAAYHEVARRFGSAPAARLARNKLAVLKKDPEVAAGFLYREAERYAAKRRRDVAIPLLKEILGKRRYARTGYRAKAAALLARLEAAAAGNELTPEQVQRARKWLIVGDIHALNGRSGKAIESYRTVQEEFEDTKYAQMALDRIAALRKKD